MAKRVEEQEEGTVLEKALATDLREVADLLEKGDLSAIPQLLAKNLPAYLFAHVGNWAGTLALNLFSR